MLAKEVAAAMSSQFLLLESELASEDRDILVIWSVSDWLRLMPECSLTLRLADDDDDDEVSFAGLCCC